MPDQFVLSEIDEKVSLIMLYATQTEVGREFGQRVKESGLKAALDWRRGQFRE
jgi:hypothetical protein